MRIPSQFNQDSLYGRDNRQRDTAASQRRLVRLVIGLALVIVVMRQASRPAMYQTFFDPSSGTTAMAPIAGDSMSLPQGADETSMRQKHGNSPTHTLSSGRPPAVVVTSDDRRIANRIVAELLPTDQRQWVVALSHLRTHGRVDSVPSSIESILSQLSSMDGIADPQRMNWQRTFQDFPDSSFENQPQLTAMFTALGDAANSRVVDGSVWRAGDFDSLYRFLDQANQMPPEGVASIGVIPLLQQPDVFRNQWVEIQGGVARCEQIEAQGNPFGITHYWQLWLRPSDGADRPMVAIVPSIPDTVAAVGSNTTTTEGPEVVVVGRYLKRLAYKSGIGADLAPVIVGAITSAPASERERERLRGLAAADAGLPIWLPVVFACLIGVASAALVMWRTSVAAKRARALRASRGAGSGLLFEDIRHAESINSTNDKDL